MRTVRVTLAIGLMGLLVLVGCSRPQFDPAVGSGTEDAQAKTVPEAGAEAQAQRSQKGFAARVGAEPAPLGAPAEDEPLAQGIPEVPPDGDLGEGERVIRNANLSVRIGEREFQTKLQKANDVAAKFGGFVAQTSTEETEGRIAS
ncbi:MAG: hypothetical protein LC808_38220, partial [Actinobacteria bacterium]|nr:hypothetical protein [Actinomycetota bacterium]